MNIHTRAIKAIVVKDIHGLLPLILLGLVIFFLQPVIANASLEELTGDAEFWRSLQANFYWFGYFIATLLMISVLQQDPAASLDNDWLTRPVGQTDWILAKLAFLLITVIIPVLVARILTNLGNDFGFGLSISYAFGFEKLPGVLPIPLLFAVALLTPNLRSFIFTLILALLVFLIPAWSVTYPILATLGVDIGGDVDGLMWLQSLPILATGLFGSFLVYWFLYCRREALRAKSVFWGGVVVVFFSVYPPSSIYGWDKAVAIHQGMINKDNRELDDRVMLEHSTACFPAALLTTDVTAPQNEALLERAAWIPEFITQAGDGAVTFATTVAYRNEMVERFAPSTLDRELTIDWRLDRFRTRAYYSADSLDQDIELRRSNTAINRFAPISNVETDYWLLPREFVDQLSQDPSTQLTITHDLVLLSPLTQELRADGQRRDLGDLGSCRAQVDGNGSTVEIDCIKRGERPELVSAELIGIAASRVDNWTRSNLTANWVESFGRSQYTLTIENANLVDSSVVLLTSYNAERLLQKEVISPGFLGDTNAICPLPGDDHYAATAQTSWSDRSPHEVATVTVERGVRVEVLDWRDGDAPVGAPTLLLLPGLGATAHSFDEVAPKLAQSYNVVAMSRRGFGASSRPNSGYGIERLSEDVLQVIEALQLQSVVLVGMSIASEELNYLGANFAERFEGLVYLDAAYDRTGASSERYRQLSVSLPPRPPVRPSEATSYEALSSFAERIGMPRNIPEGELIASYSLDSWTSKHSSRYMDAIMMGLQAPQYERITIPALGIYALPGSADFLMEPWYDAADPNVQATVSELFQLERERKLEDIARFDREIPNSDVLILEDGYHWVFLAHERQVLEAVSHFVDQL